MAPLPKKRHSTERKGKRRAAIRLNMVNAGICPKCSSLKKPHRVCVNCGFYKA